jgi:hypothetical protein
MPRVDFGNLEELDPRELWRNEERDFTPWIADNCQQLSKVIGIPFAVEQTEKKVGGYELDIFGRIEGSDAPVIIENQLGETDHKHLGQVITYAAGLEAAVIVWIAAKVTDEHRTAIDWLNRNTRDSISFYLVRPEILRIDQSKPAIRFNLEAGPSETKRALQEVVDREDAPRHEFRRRFWADLLAYLAQKGHSWAEGRRTTKEGWISSPVGRAGVGVNASMALGSRMRVEIYFSNDREKKSYHLFESKKDEIEKLFSDEQVSWEPLEDAAASRVAVYRPYEKDEVSEDTPQRTDLFDWIQKNMSRFRDLAKKFIREGEQDGAANGSQPIRSETNRTSSAAGSRR